MNWYLENLKAFSGFLLSFGLIMFMVLLAVFILGLAFYKNYEPLWLIVFIPWGVSWGAVIKILDKIWGWSQ